MYFDKSCLTFDGVEVIGDNFILMNLAKLRDCPFYDIQFLSAQPTLGNGIFIIVKGNMPQHTFHMNFNIISVKKKYRILNQYIEINLVLKFELPRPSVVLLSFVSILLTSKPFDSFFLLIYFKFKYIFTLFIINITIILIVPPAFKLLLDIFTIFLKVFLNLAEIKNSNFLKRLIFDSYKISDLR